MYIDPRVAIAEGWVTGIINPDEQLQPNAIDFTIDYLFSISGAPFIISEGGKQTRGGNKLSTTDVELNGRVIQSWKLNARTVYDGLSAIHCKLPEGVVAELIIRSTFNRNGLFLTSGLYDSGFEGHVGFALHNQSTGEAFIAPGTRVGQIKFIKSDSAGTYAGQYNHVEGSDGDWRS